MFNITLSAGGEEGDGIRKNALFLRFLPPSSFWSGVLFPPLQLHCLVPGHDVEVYAAGLLRGRGRLRAEGGGVLALLVGGSLALHRNNSAMGQERRCKSMVTGAGDMFKAKITKK